MHAQPTARATPRVKGWLCDFRRIGGFPVTLAFLFDASRNKLIAAAQFRAPVLLRPGTSLYVMYKARIAGRRLSRDFARC